MSPANAAPLGGFPPDRPRTSVGFASAPAAAAGGGTPAAPSTSSQDRLPALSRHASGSGVGSANPNAKKRTAASSFQAAGQPHGVQPAPPPPALTDVLRQKLLEAPALFASLVQLRRDAALDQQAYARNPLLASEEDDALAKEWDKSVEAARQKRRSEIVGAESELVELLAELVRDVAGSVLHGMVQRNEVAIAPDGQPKAMRSTELKELREQLASVSAERESLAQQVDALESSFVERLAGLERSFEQKLADLETRVSSTAVASTSQPQQGDPRIRPSSAAGSTLTSLSASTSPRPVVQSVSKADFDDLTTKYDKLAALVGAADLSAASSSSSTVLGKRARSADATEPDAPASPPPAAAPSLAAKLAAVEARVLGQDTQLASAAEERAKEVEKLAQSVKKMKKKVGAVEARVNEAHEKALEQLEKEKATTDQMQVDGKENVGADELGKLEKRVDELLQHWATELDTATANAQSAVKGIADDLAALKASPSFTTPSASVGDLTQLRADLEALDKSLSTRITSLRLPTEAQQAMINSLFGYLGAEAAAAPTKELSQMLRGRLDAWDAGLQDLQQLKQQQAGAVLEGLRRDLAMLQGQFGVLIGPGGRIAVAEGRLEKLKSRFESRLGPLAALLSYLEASVLPELQSVSEVVRRAQEFGRLPADAELGIVSADAGNSSSDGGGANGGVAGQHALQQFPLANGVNGGYGASGGAMVYDGAGGFSNGGPSGMHG
ncbi:hypothetical protein JCM10213v2_002811 [Rhodosporidiobolus nylandii]